jgi:hypothetical protein
MSAKADVQALGQERPDGRERLVRSREFANAG